MESKRIEKDNRIEWLNENNEPHRLDGPAVEWSDGGKDWHINGNFHREDGPAREYSSGSKSWWINGERHREDGPAIEWFDGVKEWYLNGEKYSKEQWGDEVLKLKLNRIKNL